MLPSMPVAACVVVSCPTIAHVDTLVSSDGILVDGDVRVSLQPAASIAVELYCTKVTVGKAASCQQNDGLRAQEGAAVSTSSGKINVDSAKDDAMRTSFFMKESNNEDEAKMLRLFHLICLSG
ncbi:hypothetical protein PHMEG_00026952 [Phytophthora megakarya]|uniref:Uncharacterized protein n=1 Tax=Phytophthora megakarya TaxID=4795 RepID=A0A225V949_9STRA|nr:hypothetical protein PHMEG_00026952 [Phytophthora megakarya]